MSKDIILTAIAQMDFTHWKGLRHDITPADLRSVFGEEIGYDSSNVISGKTVPEHSFNISEKSTDALRACIDDNKIILINLWQPKLKTSPQALINALGKPDKKYPPFEHSLYPMMSQWVYASKGITLYVKEFLIKDGQVPDNAIQAVALYSPTTVSHYWKFLGGSDQKIRKP